MNKSIISFFLLALSSGASFSQDSTRGLSVKHSNADSIANNYALVVGISSYANINHLLYADDDAYLFAEYLVNEKICEKKNVSRLIDSVATTANFYKELTRLKNKVQPNDRVFIYFAGHGDVETDLESGFLLTYNCESNNYPATAIDISMLEKYVNAFVNKKAKVVLITDACRSGNLAGGLTGASTTMSSITKGFQNIIKILSCQPTQLSQEKNYPGGGHGVFTYHLVDGLSGLADTNGDSSINLREIGFYLDKVRTETNEQQEPKVDGDPKKNIASFDETIKLALLAAKKDNTAIAVNPRKKDRGEDSTWINNPYFQAFNAQIRELHFIEPEGNNAYFTIDEARKKNQPAALIEDMKLELSALLEDEAQKWINKYLRGEFEERTAGVLADLKKVKKYLETIENIIGEKDLRFTEIHVKKIFFDAYYVFRRNDSTSYANAILELETANKLMPNQAWIYNLCGILYSDIKKYIESESAYKKAIKLAPSWAYPWNNLGSFYYEQKKYAETEAAYKKAIQIDPDFADAWFNLGILYEILKKYTEAEAAYKKAIQVDTDFVHPWYNLGAFYYDLKKYAEAEAAYKKVTQIDPNNADSWYNLGIVYDDQKKYAEAETAYKKATWINARYAPAWNNLGTLYNKLQKYTEAETAFKKAVGIDAHNAIIWTNLGNLYDDQKKYTEAEAAWKKAIKIDAYFPYPWLNLGILYSRQQKYTEAEIAYKKAIQIDADYAEPWNNLGNLYRDQKKYTEAEMAYKKAIQINPDYAAPWNGLGNLYKDLKKYTEAEAAFKKASQIDSKLH